LGTKKLSHKASNVSNNATQTRPSHKMGEKKVAKKRVTLERLSNRKIERPKSFLLSKKRNTPMRPGKTPWKNT